MRIEELHKILYNILYKIDDVCEKEKIQYSLYDGSLIGAVREKGIIPWDDDIDIIISKNDYKKFVQAMKDNLPSYFKVVEPKDFNDTFYDFTLRIQDTRYNWHEPNEADEYYNNNQNYINVDVFTYNDVSNYKIGLKLHALKIKFVYGLAMGHRYKINMNDYAGLNKLVVFILSNIGKKIKMNKIYDMYDKLSCEYNKPKKYMCVCNELINYTNLLVESKWYENFEKKMFGNRMLPVTKNYHEHLTLRYGDYMNPPKDRSQYITHMVFDDNDY